MVTSITSPVEDEISGEAQVKGGSISSYLRMSLAKKGHRCCFGWSTLVAQVHRDPKDRQFLVGRRLRDAIPSALRLSHYAFNFDVERVGAFMLPIYGLRLASMKQRKTRIVVGFAFPAS
jgi:hypothetical protein